MLTCPETTLMSMSRTMAAWSDGDMPGYVSAIKSDSI
jgi:hypothetical protein